MLQMRALHWNRRLGVGGLHLAMSLLIEAPAYGLWMVLSMRAVPRLVASRS